MRMIGLWRPDEIQRPTWFLEFDWVLQNEIISVHDKLCSPDSPLTLQEMKRKKKSPYYYQDHYVWKDVITQCMTNRSSIPDSVVPYSNGELRDPAQDSRYEHPAVEVSKKARHRSPCVITLGDRDNRIDH
jgi:hypothetical protein